MQEAGADQSPEPLCCWLCAAVCGVWGRCEYVSVYRQGSQMHRQAVEQRLSNISGGQSSFLARQRQANTRRLHGNR